MKLGDKVVDIEKCRRIMESRGKKGLQAWAEANDFSEEEYKLILAHVSKLQTPRVVSDGFGRHFVECFSSEQAEQVFADHMLARGERKKKEQADRDRRIMYRVHGLVKRDNLTTEEFFEQFMAIFDEDEMLQETDGGGDT